MKNVEMNVDGNILTIKSTCLVDARGCKESDEVVLVTMGSLVNTAQVAAELASELGTPTGVLKIRMFNPFPNKAVKEALKNAKAVIALERVMNCRERIG